jgi:hypothetical protein
VLEIKIIPNIGKGIRDKDELVFFFDVEIKKKPTRKSIYLIQVFLECKWNFRKLSLLWDV